MTFEDKIKELLENHGMFGRQITEVLSYAKNHELLKTIEGKWHEDIEGYPQTMVTVIWLSMKVIVIEWIDAECPQAFFRPMFI